MSPFVVETSLGLDRLFLAILSASYKNEVLEDGSTRVIMQIPPSLAPNKVAVLPLLGKDSLPEKARDLMAELMLDFECVYEEKDSIGKRYRRQDAIGTPYCITIDHQSLEDNTVTIRDRDTMQQERVSIDQLLSIIEEKVSMNHLLKLLK